MLTEYQQRLHDRVLAAPVVTPPPPWRHPADAYAYRPVGGLLGVGFGVDPDGRDLLMVVSTDGHGVIDTHDYAKLARNRDPPGVTLMPPSRANSRTRSRSLHRRIH